MNIIHSYCGRILSRGDYDEYIDGDGTDSLLSHQFPAISVISLEVDGIVKDSKSFVLYASQGFLRLKSGVFPRGKKNVRLQYTAGYATIPKDIERVCSELVAGAKIEDRPDIQRVLDMYRKWGY